MFFSYKKRTKRILNISKGRAPGMVPSPVLFAASGDAAPCTVGADSISARGTLWLRKHPRRGEGTPPYKVTVR